MKFKTEWERRRYEKAKADYDLFIKVYDFQLNDLKGEIWLPIPDWEDYQESNYGRTKRFYKNGEVKILKPALNKDGYLQVYLHKGGKKKNFKVARLVATLFIPNPDNKPQVNHIYSRFSNHVDCLEWTTHAENMQHAVDTGLIKSGEDSPDAKLTNEQVLYIRENPDGLNTQQLAAMFGVGQTTISLIQRGKIWKQAGGTVRGNLQGGLPRIPDDVREQIRAEYVKDSRQFGSTALAKKYGVDHATILNIIHESR